jgi:phosphatidylserine/phosphatidylglycerophosphate/cardiolipin synthase-like enzyme
LNDTNLATALQGALERGVSIDLASTHDSLQGLDLTSLTMPGRGQLRLFQPAANQKAEKILGSHAKFYVADGKRAYIGSANMTYLGLNQHLEMGVMVQGNVAQQIEQFWRYLLEIGFFLEIDI